MFKYLKLKSEKVTLKSCISFIYRYRCYRNNNIFHYFISIVIKL